MSAGHGAWESRIDIGYQDSGAGADPGAWYTLQLEAADSLSFGPVMLDRNPTYGARTRPEESYKLDHELPAGNIGDWALKMDENNRGLLMLLDLFYQRSAVVSGGTAAPDDWTFQPLGTYTDHDSLHLYGIRKVVGDGGTRDEKYLDCIGNSLAWSWSAGNAFTLGVGINSLTAEYDAAAAADGTFGGVVLTAPEITPKLIINGTTYTIYPSAMSGNESNNLIDAPSASSAQRQRHVVGGFTGDVSLTLPRNQMLSKIEDAVDNYYTGTLQILFQPSTGTYTSGGGTLYARYQTYIRFDKPAPPVGGDGELMLDVTGQIVGSSTWSIKSELATVNG